MSGTRSREVRATALASVTLMFATMADVQAGSIIYLKSAQNQQYVRAGVTGDGYLAAASAHPGGWETFEWIDRGRGQVSLKSLQNGLFVRAGVTATSYLAAVSSTASTWETFRIENLDGDRIALRSAQSGLYVRAGISNHAILGATSRARGSWETFRVVQSGLQALTIPSGATEASRRAIGTFHANLHRSRGTIEFQGRTRVLDLPTYRSSLLKAFVTNLSSRTPEMTWTNAGARSIEICVRVPFEKRGSEITVEGRGPLGWSDTLAPDIQWDGNAAVTLRSEISIESDGNLRLSTPRVQVTGNFEVMNISLGNYSDRIKNQIRSGVESSIGPEFVRIEQAINQHPSVAAARHLLSRLGRIESMRVSANQDIVILYRAGSAD